MSRHSDSITTSSMAAENSRTRCSLREEFVRSSVLLETEVEKVLMENGWEKALAWECPFVHRQQGHLLFENVDDIKMIGKKNDLQPIWQRWMEQVDLEKRTQPLD